MEAPRKTNSVYDLEKSKFYNYVMKTFNYSPKLHELIPMANILSQKINVPLTRDPKRVLGKLYEWFDQNYEKIEPYLSNFVWELNSDQYRGIKAEEFLKETRLN